MVKSKELFREADKGLGIAEQGESHRTARPTAQC